MENGRNTVNGIVPYTYLWIRLLGGVVRFGLVVVSRPVSTGDGSSAGTAMHDTGL